MIGTMTEKQYIRRVKQALPYDTIRTMQPCIKSTNVTIALLLAVLNMLNESRTPTRQRAVIGEITNLENKMEIKAFLDGILRGSVVDGVLLDSVATAGFELPPTKDPASTKSAAGTYAAPSVLHAPKRGVAIPLKKSVRRSGFAPTIIPKRQATTGGDRSFFNSATTRATP
jgi:hypothetical protein